MSPIHVSSKLEYLNMGRGPKEDWHINQWTGLQIGLLWGHKPRNPAEVQALGQNTVDQGSIPKCSGWDNWAGDGN